VIEEDAEPEARGRELAAPRRRRPAGHAVHDAEHAAVAGNDADHAADHQREQDDRDVIGIRERVAQVDGHCVEQASPRRAEVAAVHEERTEPEAGEQRDDDLPEREREADRDERRQNRNPGSGHRPPYRGAKAPLLQFYRDAESVAPTYAYHRRWWLNVG